MEHRPYCDLYHLLREYAWSFQMYVVYLVLLLIFFHFLLVSEGCTDLLKLASNGAIPFKDENMDHGYIELSSDGHFTLYNYSEKLLYVRVM